MLKNLTTEARNPASESLDSLSAIEIVRLMNAEDARVAEAVGGQTAAIARAIEAIAERLRAGGRLIYLGAGTSGRLGMIDAAECPPTFNTPPELVVGLIAGGPDAMTQSIEGAEDRPEQAVLDLRQIGVSRGDAVVGIATSGRTPYVLGGLDYARQLGAFTIGLTCNREAALANHAELVIAPVVGPEVLSGSTRLKAGTATKMVLNMLTTGAMVLLGKTYGNLMVDVRASNSKLRDRSQRIVAALTGLSEAETQSHLDRCGGEVKTAIVAVRRSLSADEARQLLAECGGHLRRAIEGPGARVEGRGSRVEGRESRDEGKAQVGEGRRERGEPPGRELLLGIDGGGTKTVAWLATRQASGEPHVLGRGAAGPSNVQAVGFPAALENLDRAIAAAFAEAGMKPEPAAAAVLALAGSDREENRRVLRRWAEERSLAKNLSIVHDALPLLAAGSPEGWGVALIAGTGSICFGRGRDGQTARAGGWGFLFGDEGSGYAIAVAGLRAAAQAGDGRAPATQLLPAMLKQLSVTRSEDLVGAVYPLAGDRAAIAALADVVFQVAAAGDAPAVGILAAAARELAAAVAAVARTLHVDSLPFPLALAGGLLLSHESLRHALASALHAIGLVPDPIRQVSEPVSGAVLLAAQAAEVSTTTVHPSIARNWVKR